MADVVSAVRSYLLADGTVNGYIGQRIYLDRLRQNASLPAATIHKTSEVHPHYLSDRVGIVQTRLQLDCYSTVRLTANLIAEAMIKSGICAVKGTTHGVEILGVMIDEGQQNFVIEDADGGDDPLYVTEFDLLVSYQE